MTVTAATRPEFLLRTLGAAELCELDAHGSPLPRLLGPGKPLALLAYCCAVRDREHSRDFLSSLLWSDADATRSRQSLRQALWRLRKLVGDAVRTRDDAVLSVDATVDCDRDRFLAAVHRGDAAAALREYGGPFLIGLNAPGGDEFEDWATLERRQLEDALVRVVTPHVRSLVQSGKPSQARDAIERLTSLASEHLEAHRLAVEIFLDLNERTEARRAADALENIARSLGGRAPALVETLVARARDTDHDVDTVGSPDAPSALVLDLVGREETFAAVMRAWHRARAGESNVIVLTGVAGIGKSRLLTAISQRCASRRTLAVIVRANAGEREVPFGFPAAIARTLASLPGAAGVSSETARELVALDPGLASLFATTPSVDDGGEAVRRRALALFDLLGAIAEQNPLALCLDDLHWSDSASRQLLAVVVGRIAELPLMVVVTTRGSAANLFDQRTVVSLPLLPLESDAVIDAVRSSGTWPDEPGVTRFMDMLTSVCEGIPLSVMERLALVRERGLLSLQHGTWSSRDWDAASREIAVASPLDRRLADCDEYEHAALLALAVAGTPLATSIIERTAARLVSSPRHTPTQRARVADVSPTQSALQLLEVKGLTVRAGEQWTVNHDVVAERTLVLASTESRTRCHVAMAEAFADTGTPDGTVRAVRHFLDGGDDTRAGDEFARVVARARAIGDQRPVADLLSEISGERFAPLRVRAVLRRVPFWHRVTAFRTRLLVSALIVVAGASLVSSWVALRRPVLRVAQTANSTKKSSGNFATKLDTVLYGPDVRATSPSVVISLSEGERLVNRPTYVRVQSHTTGTRILAGDSAPVIDGEASFNRLRFLSTDSITSFRFTADGFRSVDVSVGRAERMTKRLPLGSELRLIEARINGRVLRSVNDRLDVQPGDSITGIIEMEYTSSLTAASVWLSMTPTWGDPKVEGHELSPLATPVERELLKLQLNTRAPTTKGHYWIAYIMAAEPSGGFALSQTNWENERAVWGDGNDIAQLPDSMFRLSNARGFIDNYVAYPIDYDEHQRQCKVPDNAARIRRIKYCVGPRVMFAIEVKVE